MNHLQVLLPVLHHCLCSWLLVAVQNQAGAKIAAVLGMWCPSFDEGMYGIEDKALAKRLLLLSRLFVSLNLNCPISLCSQCSLDSNHAIIQKGLLTFRPQFFGLHQSNTEQNNRTTQLIVLLHWSDWCLLISCTVINVSTVYIT